MELTPEIPFVVVLMVGTSLAERTTAALAGGLNALTLSHVTCEGDS